MSTLPGSGVPSMTSVLPDGGGESSGLVWMILVGVDSYCFNFSVAVATPLSVPPEEEEDDGLEESDESDPQADNPMPMTKAAASAENEVMRIRALERAMLT